MKIIILEPVHGGQRLYSSVEDFKTWVDNETDFDNAEWKITLSEISEEEYNKLPEHSGF